MLLKRGTLKRNASYAVVQPWCSIQAAPRIYGVAHPSDKTCIFVKGSANLCQMDESSTGCGRIIILFSGKAVDSNGISSKYFLMFLSECSIRLINSILSLKRAISDPVFLKPHQQHFLNLLLNSVRLYRYN